MMATLPYFLIFGITLMVLLSSFAESTEPTKDEVCIQAYKTINQIFKETIPPNLGHQADWQAKIWKESIATFTDMCFSSLPNGVPP